MNIQAINEKLSLGEIEHAELFPHLKRLKNAPFVFKTEFGLDELPREPGILLIRGARQYGKSTWLEQELIKTIKQFGAGSAYYLNGDNIPNLDFLEKEIEKLIPIFSRDALVQRLFIDEITSIENWEIALKRLVDNGKLEKVLVVTTGSKATDLRRGAEKLPGRKGKLSRSSYLFTPISYREFHRVCSETLGKNTLIAYLLSGGSPIACTELATQGVIPEYVVELVRDWIEGELAFAARSRSSLLNIMQVLFRFGTTPVGQAKLAREANLANNTVAASYIDILNDLGCIVPAYPWDSGRHSLILRKPCKYHFTNLLAALAYHPAQVRSVADFLSLPESTQGFWYEWLIAQEIIRRKAISTGKILEPLAFWQTKEHEIDFVVSKELLIEVKRGNSSPHEFNWFSRQFSQENLLVINAKKFNAPQITGIMIEEFLLLDQFDDSTKGKLI